MDGRAKRALVATATTAIMLPGLTGTAWAHDAQPVDHYHWDYHATDYHVDQPDQPPPTIDPTVCDETDRFDPYAGTCVEAEQEQAPPDEDNDDDSVEAVPEPVQVVLHSHGYEEHAVTHDHPARAHVSHHLDEGDSGAPYEGTYVTYHTHADSQPTYHHGFPYWWFEFH